MTAAKLAALVVTASALAAPAAASAADARCTHDPATATTTVNLTPGGVYASSIFVNFEDAIAIDDADINPPDPACGDTTNTDTVAITGSLPGPSDFLYINTNTANRPFAPGLTDEPGNSDEIEFIATVTGGKLGIDHSIRGVGSVNDTATVLGKNAINLNAFEADGVDADVALEGPTGAFVAGDRADDLVDGRGGTGTPALPFALPLAADGLGGDDELFGGAQGDELYGDAGRDEIRGEDGDDKRLRGGDDDDRVIGGDGADRLFGDDGDDVIKGGPGRDLCKGGPGRDVFNQCEVVRDR
jgi:Ca2+-binding RTX toxin-like protein